VRIAVTGAAGRLFSFDRALKLGKHRRFTTLGQRPIIEPVCRHQLIGCNTHHTRASVDACDGAVEQLSVVLKVFQALDAVLIDNVLRDGQRQQRFIVPGTDFFDILAVFVPVLGMSRRQPSVEEDIHVALSETCVERRNVKAGNRDIVAVFFKDLGPQVGDRNALSPLDQTDLDRLALA
jgi:hypothetical protein